MILLIALCSLACSDVGADEAVAPLGRTQQLILESAKEQAEQGAFYDARYVKMEYPGGDVPEDRGACTDVVIRSLRAAGYDLQELIHEDSKKRNYPRIGSNRDSNIDHRRCPNQIYFLEKFGTELTTKTSGLALSEWQPGDIVYWKLDSGLDHTGIISDAKSDRGVPLVIHNLGRCREQDVLTEWKIVGHFRFPKG